MNDQYLQHFDLVFFLFISFHHFFTLLFMLRIGGATLHSWTFIGKGETPTELARTWKVKDLWRQLQVLIIDEVLPILSCPYDSRFPCCEVIFSKV